MQPQDRLSYVSGLPLFQAIDFTALQDLLTYLDPVSLAGGKTLFRAGDPGDSLYIVLTGRLQVLTERGDGTQMVIRKLARGDTVGELALITGNPRSATVRAIRDTELVRISRSDFEEAVKNHPQLFRQLAVQIAHRESQGIDANLSRRTVSTVAVLAVDPRLPMANFTRRLVDALRPVGAALLLHQPPVESHAPTTAQILEDRQASARLSELESSHRLVVYEADALFSSWTETCIRQADLILIVATADSAPDVARLEVLKSYFSRHQIIAGIELVLVHQKHFEPRVKVNPWLSLLPFEGHHHIVSDSTADFAKLARLLTGTAVSLVLSGGGARGFAHIGVIRALSERGVPIDAIGGTSMGAVIAAQHALGWDWQTMTQVNRCEWPRCEPQKNYTLPLVALNSGRRMDQMLRTMFADAEIENLPTKFFCVSTNLTRAEAMIHRQGSLWKAVRASVSIPGIGPPAIEHGEILVDGGLINNLPVDVMKRFCQGTVVAVDVSEQLKFESKLTESYTVSGWKLLWQRLNPFAQRSDIPNILNILYRTTTVGSIRVIEEAKAAADLYLSPPVSDFGVFDWRSIDEIIDIGYRDALRALEQTTLPQHRTQRRTPTG